MHRRKKTLVRPDLQLKMIASCGLVVFLSLVLQGILTAVTLHRVASGLPNDSLAVLDAIPGTLTANLALTMGLLAPLVFAVGLRYSHRITGPLHRIEDTLQGVLGGSDQRVGELRKGDELGELAELVDALLERVHTPLAPTATASPQPEPAAPLPAATESAPHDPAA